MATILIVDDRPANRDYLVALLSPEGHHLLEARDGLAALESARREPPDLIISDILMPIVDGFAMVRELRADAALQATPVIFCSAAYLEHEAHELAQRYGVTQILLKPVERAALLAAIEAALNTARSSDIALNANSTDVEHLALLTNKLYQKVEELETANIKLAQRTVELAHANSKLQNLSLTDELTGLYNRRGFMHLGARQLQLMHRTQRPSYMLFIDVDDLKTINDQFGHQHGDMALTQVGKTLRQTFRGSDIIARIGGDEFAVMAIDAADELERLIQERLQKNLKIHVNNSGASLDLSISLGAIRIHADNQRSLEELLTEADAVMYVQKHNKKQQKLLNGG